ncbi:MAG: TraR/DksA family transcriptional regulator [Muribaculaceae bacterium]|nr:TraR/DksA family transcriptional regulator [Muribaculaceae bacterium]
MADNIEKTRYTDEELQEFKQVILDKLAHAQANLELLKSNIMVDESDPTFKVMEEGANTLSKEEASQRAQRQQQFINKLQAALVRIEKGTYGICRITGKLIPKGRLLAVPHATTSVEGKEIEQQRKLRP